MLLAEPIQNKPTIPSGNQIIDWTTDNSTYDIHADNIPTLNQNTTGSQEVFAIRCFYRGTGQTSYVDNQSYGKTAGNTLEKLHLLRNNITITNRRSIDNRC